MCAMTSAERRMDRRYPLSTSVNFFHGPSNREFPARCVDVSRGGMLMYVPVSTPVKVGQPLRLNVGSVSRPEFAGLSEKPMDGTIARVDRHRMLEEGYVAVGVRFTEA